jgi:hypothetical protein
MNDLIGLILIEIEVCKDWLKLKVRTSFRLSPVYVIVSAVTVPPPFLVTSSSLYSVDI